jgi:hypothetical protein
MLRLKVFLFALFTNFSLYAQEYTFKGTVKSFETGTPIPFAILETEDGRFFFSDLQGQFSIPHHLPFLNTIVRNYYFITREYRLHLLEENILIYMLPHKEIPVLRSTESKTSSFIKEVISKKAENNPEAGGNFRYHTYSRFVISAERVGRLKQNISQLLLLFGVNVNKYPNNQHHVFLLESATERIYKNKLNQREVIVGSKASGIDNPSILTVSSLIQSLNVYGNYINIATQEYLSPLNNEGLSTYFYTMHDTIYAGKDTLYVVKFNPSENREDLLHGLLYISTDNLAIKFASIRTTFNDPNIHLYQEYEKHKDGPWFTKRSKTEFLEENFLNLGEDLYFNFTTDYHNILLGQNLENENFDDVIIRYDYVLSKGTDEFWDTRRTTRLTEEEKNTYEFYESIGSIKNFERLVRFGEGYFDGTLPIGKVNIEPNRFLSVNRYEGLRLGAGLETNELFSRKYFFGGYFGYGFRDKTFKYSARAGINLLPENRLTLTGAYRSEILEAGGIFLPFDQPQFSSENIRSFGLMIFDRVNEPYINIQSHPVRYWDFNMRLTRQTIIPLYEYQFRDITSDRFLFTELSLGFKFAYGEQFLESLFYRHSLGSNYPKLWFQFSRGFNRESPIDLSYNRYIGRIDHSFNNLLFGTTRFRLLGGYVAGNAPYPKLFNMIGSLMEPSVIIHNAFETMDFNEFLSDRFAALFLSHSFPRVVLSTRFNIRPVPQIIQNFGVGTLQNPLDHRLINFRTMEEGYFETGFIVNDFLILNSLGLKVGLGAGVFLRYGPYALPNLNENFVFKYALNLKI